MDPTRIRVLLVEDDLGDATLLRESFREAEDVRVAVTHVQELASGLELMGDGKVDVVLLDLNLPDSAGLDTFRTAQACNPDLPIVVMTGAEVNALAITAVREGAADYLYKGRLESGSLVRSVRYAIERAARTRAERKLHAVELQLDIARHIQRRLYPAAPAAATGVAIAGHCTAAEKVGGDYYDYRSPSDGEMDLAVGDVSGHGLGAALTMAQARATIRALAAGRLPLDQLLARANRLLWEETDDDLFVSLLLARLDLCRRTLTYASAGHPTGFILDASGAIRVALPSFDPPLALTAEATFAVSPPIGLLPGDMIVLYTDGLVEAGQPDRPAYGVERALACVAAHAHLPPAQIIARLEAEVAAHCAPFLPLDDVTVMLAKV